jgi:gliding motility-associated-like protein
VFGDTVKVFPAPLITFTTGSVTICLGDTLFMNNTSGSDLSFNWSFGDGRTSSFRNPLYHIYSDTGSFNIILTGRSLIAPFCTGIRTVRIYVAPKPIAEFSVAGGVPLLLCQSKPVNFINRSRLATRYFWDFGISGATSLDPNPTFRYPTSGVFKVTLVAYSEFNCSDTITQFINIYPNPVPSFSVSSSIGCSPLTVNINNLTAYPSAIQGTFEWDFDNGNTHSGYYRIPTQVYTNNSTEIKKFKVKLVCTTTFGCVDTLESEITVYPSPTLGFNIVEDTMYQDSAVFRFINTTTPILTASYQWNWGDGNSTTVNDTSSIEHRYDSVGRFLVKLYITTSNGCLDSMFRFVTVLPVKPRPSFVLLGSDTLKGCRPFTIQVRNTSRYSTEYTWDFGDNIIFNNTNPPAITYYNPGVFTIKLLAKNSIGIDSFIQRNVVIVDDLPVASFTNNPKTVIIPNQKAYFLNQSTGAVKYLWDFGDNSTSDSISPEHLYRDTGSYNVTLIAYSTNGCTDTFRVNQAVKAKFDGRIQVPNAFTPGSSFGVNDVFIPVMDGAVDFKMLVFNRWGEIIFESSDSKIGWDGKHRGQICTPDLYPYKIEVVFSNGDNKSLTGKVYLIR